MSSQDSPEDRRRVFDVLGRITAWPIAGCGAVLILSGALGHDFWNRFFTGGALGLNDVVPGVVFLILGLVLLRITGHAPLTAQLLSIRQWGADRWINFAVMAVSLVVMAVAMSGPLLPAWLHYGLLALAAGAVLLWPRARDRSAQS